MGGYGIGFALIILEKGKKRRTTMSKQRILIVDDNTMMLKFWQRLLAGEAYECHTTPSAEEALEMMEALTIDVLITDLVMPHMDGFQLMRQVHQLYPHVQIVMTTGYFYDFEKLPLQKTDLHKLPIILKPYHDINNVQNFLHYLLEVEGGLKSYPPHVTTSDGRVQLWTL